MQTHLGVPTVTVQLATAILSVSVNADNQIKFGAAGACEVLLRAMQTHLAVPTVTEQLADAMYNLSANNPANMSKLKGAGVSALVDRGLKMHHSNAAVLTALQRLKTRLA